MTRTSVYVDDLIKASIRYFGLAMAMTYFRLKADTFRTYAGVLWWFLDPLLNAVIYYVLLVVIFKVRADNFVIIALTGMVVWRWFQSTVMQASNAIGANAAMTRQTHLPKLLFVTREILAQSFKGICATVVLIAFLNVMGYPINAAYVHLIPLVVVLVMFSTGLSCLLAAFVPFVSDLHEMLGYVFRLGMFASGVFFTAERIPAKYALYFELNPMFVIIEAFRDVLMAGTAPAAAPLLGVAVLSLLLFAAGFAFVRRYDRVYPRIVA